MPVESPLPVGGRDKVADIPRMGKAASVVSSASGYGSGGSISASESEAESLQSASQKDDESSSNDVNIDTVPGIVINVPVDRSSKASSVASSPRTPVIHVLEEEEAHQRQTPSTALPQINIDVPGISFSGPEDGGGGPSISISSAPDDKPQRRPKSQPAPQASTPQHRARSVPALATFGGNAAAQRNQRGLSCGGCGGPIIGRIVNAMGARWHPECFRCTTCDTLLEHVSSYEHEGKPYCHLDFHEVRLPRSIFSLLNTNNILCRILRPDATTARLPSLKSGSSVSMTLVLGSGRTTNRTFSALNAAIRSSRPRAPILKKTKSEAGSWPCLATASLSRITWALRSTAAIRTASRAMCGCGCPSVGGARRASEMETALSRRWAASGVGHVLFARYAWALNLVFPFS